MENKRFFRNIQKPESKNNLYKFNSKNKPTISINMSFSKLKKFYNLTLKINIFIKNLQRITTLILLIIIYLTGETIKRLFYSFKYFPLFLDKSIWKYKSFFGKIYNKTINILEHDSQSNITRIGLIDLSIKNMQAKKTRTYITIGGMALGIAIIVFMVSIGYGLQNLVISRVARLEELQQVEVSPQIGSNVKINDKSLSNFKEMQNIIKVLPLISVVGKVNYKNSDSDIAVFGVTSDYLKESAIKPTAGKIFDSNDIFKTAENFSTNNTIQNTQTQKNNIATLGAVIKTITFSIKSKEWIRVRENYDTKSKVIGYTKAENNSQTGVEIWGQTYAESSLNIATDNATLGKWIKANVYLWQKTTCITTSIDCEDGQYLKIKDAKGNQTKQAGYFAEINITDQTKKTDSLKVLATLTNTEITPISSDFQSNLSDNTVEIASLGGIMENSQVKKVNIISLVKQQAVINETALKVLGIDKNQAIGKTFRVSFIVTNDLLPTSKEKIESNPTEYTIIGVISGEKAPAFYVPFIDLRSLGMTNFSQVKLVIKNKAMLSQVRQQIEAMGFITYSVVDTIEQITNLFSRLIFILTLLGTVALAVAALGMFNTLTVSLLERTREIGLMKALGMKSNEVQELFLIESLIMSLSGGILGLIFGFIFGKLTGAILSIFSLIKGLGYIDVSTIPFLYICFIIGLSVFVGIVTGFYPAKRATTISALNALRYE